MAALGRPPSTRRGGISPWRQRALLALSCAVAFFLRQDWAFLLPSAQPHLLHPPPTTGWRRTAPTSSIIRYAETVTAALKEKLPAGLTDEQISEFFEEFSVFDKDGDGTITIFEMGSVMRSLGQYPRGDDLHELFTEFDEDRSGTIDFPEFCILMERKLGSESDGEIESMIRQAAQRILQSKPAAPKDTQSSPSTVIGADANRKPCQDAAEDHVAVMHAAFSFFDKDGDGFVTAEEMTDTMRALGQFPTQGDLEQMLKDFDEDNNGTIEFPEFCVLMKRKMDATNDEEEDAEIDVMFRDAIRRVLFRVEKQARAAR